MGAQSSNSARSVGELRRAQSWKLRAPMGRMPRCCYLANFDKAYAKDMVKDHQKDAKEFADAADDVKIPI